jgi:hypothetical protein
MPHIAGIQYSPKKKVRFFKGAPLGHNIEIFFSFERTAPGLILYEFCVEGDISGLALDVLLAIVAAAVVMFFVKFVLAAVAAGGVLVLT